MKNFLKIAFAFMLAISASAFAGFSSEMSPSLVESEVTYQLVSGKSVSAIAADALASGVPAAIITSALISQGQDAVKVVKVLSAIYSDKTSIFKTAMAMSSQSDELTQLALAYGLDPSLLLAPTAAGKTQDSTQSVPANSNFSSAPASTTAGGGGGSASRS